MTKENQIKLKDLMVKFNNMNGDIHQFHEVWKPFMDTLSQVDRKFATLTMMNTMLLNAQEFRKIAVHLIENGTDENRQTIAEMVKDFKQLPVFDKNRVAA